MKEKTNKKFSSFALKFKNPKYWCPKFPLKIQISRQYNWVKTARNTPLLLFVLRVKRLSATWRGTMIPSSLSLLQILLWASFQGKHRNNSHSFQSIRFKIWIFPFVPFLSVASLYYSRFWETITSSKSLVLFKQPSSGYLWAHNRWIITTILVDKRRKSNPR